MALQATLAEIGRDPWLTSIFMRRLDTIRRRFARLCDWLRALPRHVHRGRVKHWAMALPAAALLLALPKVTTDLTIPGNGDTAIQRAGGPAFNVLTSVGAGSTLTIQNCDLCG